MSNTPTDVPAVTPPPAPAPVLTPGPLADPTAGDAPIKAFPDPGTALLMGDAFVAARVVAQTPWWRNAVAVQSWIGFAAGIFFAVSPLLVTYPFPPSLQWVPTAAGIAGAVLIGLGYQGHSATVRAAELAGAGSPAVTPAGELPKAA